ncbi:MAG: hypothetical protein LUD15_10165 [Bacteroides sp.]|nr:hypothetical protein [Bacteroides sp.]
MIFDRDIFSLSNLISDIKESKGNYWITTADGLISLESESRTYTLYRSPEGGKEGNDMTALLIEGDTIYIGTRTAGMITFHLSTRTFHPFSSLENHHVKSLDRVGDSSLYVSTNGGGIKKISSRTGEILDSIEHSSDRNSISSNAVYSFLWDGNIFWVGTYMGGLNYTPSVDTLFTVYNYEDKFDSRYHNIRSFKIGKESKLIGTRNGLYYIAEDKEEVFLYTTRNSVLTSDIILSVFPYKDGYLIGTY